MKRRAADRQGPVARAAGAVPRRAHGRRRRELRQDMWQLVRSLRETGVTIILTTHYIDEAEEMADRIGVISKGEIILVEDKVELMRKLGQEAADAAACSSRWQRIPAALSAHAAGAVRRRQRADLHLRRAAASTRASPRCWRTWTARASPSRTCRPARVRWKTSSSAWCREEARMNLHAVRAIYRFEMARTWRTLLQSIVSPVVSTSLYFVVFGSAIGSRIPEVGRRQLRRLHRAGPGDAVAADAKHLQRLVRHLLSQVHRHDLRAAVGAGLHAGDRGELCRRGRHQVDRSSA